ncbi:hypothetical protein [Parasutterella excrementihominis]|uniref:hypothetical protein n=1 Tax=Parasutterella excrementihominis TaxID=487175 RepID=UPI003078C3E3
MDTYRISIETYNKEFVTLPDKYKLLLFKLQVSYCFKGAPLNQFDIAGIANTDLPLDATIKQFLNNYFVETANGEWSCPIVDIQIKEERIRIEKEVQKRVARALAGMKGGLSKSRNRKNQNTLVSEGEILISEVQEEQQAFCEEPEDLKQTSSKPLANGYQTPSKTVANGWQNPRKVVANAKQTSSKELANSKQSSSKVVANTKQTFGKTLANENFATTEESQPVDFVEETENLQLAPEIEPEDDPSLACACVCASDNPINPISDYFLINKNNKNKSESVSESVKEKTENFKNQNSREIEKFSAGKNWTLQEAQTLLVDSGLDKKFLEAWVSRSDRNQTRFNALLSDVLPRFDREAFDLLIARCKEQKRSEGAMFAGSIAYVISALEREPVTAKRRPKKRSSERDYTEGLIQNPDGSWSPDPNYVSKTKKYSDRDWTEGLIKNPDGSYSLDPNYEH